MKYRLLLLCPIFFLFINAHAQTNAGSQNVGVNLGYSNTTSTTTFSNPTYTPSSLTTTSKQTTYSIAPGYSFFIGNKVDLGLALGITGAIYTYDYAPTPYTPTKTNYVAYSGTIYLRKYFLFQDKIGVRTGPFFLYQQSTQKNYYPTGSTYNNNSDNKVDTYSTGVNLEFVFYPSRKLGLAANICNLNYSYLKSKTADGVGETDSSQKTFNASFVTNNLSLSLFFIFGNK